MRSLASRSIIASGFCVSLCLAVFHPFQLHPVGIKKEDRVVVIVIFPCRIDDRGFQFVAQKRIELVHILAAAKLKGIVMKADVADAVFALLGTRLRGRPIQKRVWPFVQPMVSGYSSEF